MSGVNRVGTIIWDWNGTLLDDVDACIEVENAMFMERGVPAMTRERYLDIFGFPIVDFYRVAGMSFERETYEELTEIYARLYLERAKSCCLADGAAHALDTFRRMGFRQVVLSASFDGWLRDQMSAFAIEGYFSDVIGQDTAAANGKLETARRCLAGLAGRVVLIGDTDHDLEVAAGLGADCVLVAAGHQARHRLERLAAERAKDSCAARVDVCASLFEAVSIV